MLALIVLGTTSSGPFLHLIPVLLLRRVKVVQDWTVKALILEGTQKKKSYCMNYGDTEIQNPNKKVIIVKKMFYC